MGSINLDLNVNPGCAGRTLGAGEYPRRNPVKENRLEMRVCNGCDRWRALDWFISENGLCWRCRQLKKV